MSKDGVGREGPADARGWADGAVAAIEADQRRSADTHLWKLDTPALAGIDLYLKDESTHPTGSLKHRLARSLFLYALCNGHIRKGTAVVVNPTHFAVALKYEAGESAAVSTRGAIPASP